MNTYTVTKAGAAVAWFTVTVVADSPEDAIRIVERGEDELQEGAVREYDWDWDGASSAPDTYDVEEV